MKDKVAVEKNRKITRHGILILVSTLFIVPIYAFIEYLVLGFGHSSFISLQDMRHTSSALPFWLFSCFTAIFIAKKGRFCIFIGICNIVACIYYIAAVYSLFSFNFILFLMMYPLICGVITISGVVNSVRSSRRDETHFRVIPRWLRKNWPIILVTFSVLAYFQYDLRTRGPIEVVIETDGTNNDHFLVSVSIPYRSDDDTHFSSHELKPIMGKAGEPILIPRSYLNSLKGLFDGFSQPKVTAFLYVHHPQYRHVSSSKDIELAYNLWHKPSRLTIKMKHWDKVFAEQVNSWNVNESMRRTFTNFTNTLNSLKESSWYQQFNDSEREKIKQQYLPWIQEKLEKYAKYNCYSKVDCEANLKSGNIKSYEKSDWPFNS